ncbi:MULTISPECIES: 3-dehydroquinate synthase [unclassified Veillonella]|uniref:3-dehydroquinate synthase n=1 Tax=unclassified Veillonella TaxID=2630086 RepID=UPI000F8D0E5C|nr:MULTISPECIES: 3-dehydroquinate synthase [unclassified Veillonella]
MDTIHIQASTDYDVIIERNSLPRIAEFLQAIKPACSVMIVTDDNVGPLYASTVSKSLETAGYTVHTYTFPHGESEKNGHRLMDLMETLGQAKLTRKDLIIALGGGVVGDLAGFAAATFLRGIDYVQIPTSLLAAVDSSVGGKTAVNLDCGKNLWGAFKQPILVLCDPETLSTLPKEEWINGCGEIIKYGFLGHPELLDQLRERPLLQHPKDVDTIITQCVRIKAYVVEVDEKESGLRATLNLGHTFGHGIEHGSAFTIPHGNAVALGLLIMARGAVAHEELDPTIIACIEQLLIAHELPTSTTISRDLILEEASHDKKASGSSITIVVPTGYGTSVLKKVKFEELAAYCIL